ncbi:MAG: hypothetical protein MUF56_00255 [Solirubrobacteraceae bacterium]|jgi:TrkA domain protein|nr:hypothetical protein [Solirubrobacteraceae bacterium]
MAAIDETPLPGVGVRRDFTTARGERVGVLEKLSGERELLVFDRADPDACRVTLRMEEAEAETLAELLGAPQLTHGLGAIREAVGDLVVEWLTIEPGSPFAGRTIGDSRLRTRTGVSVVAVLHGDHATPAPGPEQPLHPGDTLLAVGTLEGTRAAERLLRDG